MSRISKTVFAAVLASATALSPIAASAETILGALSKAYQNNSQLNSARAGTRVTDSDLQGKWTVVNFWNTWCVPCQQELPELKKFAQSHASDDSVQMIGIVRDPQEPEAVIKKYAEATGMDWTLALDPGSKAALDFATRGQPETFLIAPNGRVLVYFYGPVTAKALDQALAAAGGPVS